MKPLYDMPRKVWVELLDDKVTIPPASQDPGKIVFFDHVDGMYSFCVTPDDEIVHPAAWTKARVVA